MAILTMSNVHKRYGGVRALNGAGLEAHAGEVLGLLGPNGSGKSTMNKVLTGVVAPDEAEITINGERVRISSPRDAAKAGIAAVYQQLTLIPYLTVEQNLVLGVEETRGGFLHQKSNRQTALNILERLAPALGPGASAQRLVKDLTPGQQQLIEFGKALIRNPRILILDEATASLHRTQVAELFKIVNELKESGTCILFVSHRLDEIFEICDRATVLRSGNSIATVHTAETSEHELVALMVDPLSEAPPAEAEAAPMQLEVLEDGGIAPEVAANTQTPVLTVTDFSGPNFENINLQIRAGEIVGLGGLQGQGQSELLGALFGWLPHKSGSVAVAGNEINLRSVRAATRAGIALVPGDRGTQGMLAVRPIQENLSVVSLPSRSLARVLIRPKKERNAARQMVQALQIKLGQLSDPISSLSGGNQQKVIIGKWLLNSPQVILLDDPTKGVDVGAKAEIYQLMRKLAEEGAAILFNSSEDRELVALADRVAVLYEGKITTVIGAEELNEDNLVAAAMQIPAPESAPGLSETGEEKP